MEIEACNVQIKRRDADLAALAVCVLFEFGQFHVAQRIQMELIASHMRIVWSMNRRREYVSADIPANQYSPLQLFIICTRSTG
jgi:hypothetical protein